MGFFRLETTHKTSLADSQCIDSIQKTRRNLGDDCHTQAGFYERIAVFHYLQVRPHFSTTAPKRPSGQLDWLFLLTTTSS